MGEKNLCKWDEKQITKRMKKLKKIVAHPQYICKRCGRAASDKGYLCKPYKFDD